ncbi:MAG TPA: amidohydrolase family protein [Candidatus Binataceae bacterium]|nr:amidohydrolase family protein [Candidatus Binataceae bacterium]
MPCDLLIKGGTVVDGTGADAYRADLAIAGGRIVRIGRIEEPADRTIDASGLIVAPGFVDPHTHFDAQIWWDSLVTSSSWHGVTTVVMGNCGVTLAPCRPADRAALLHDLVNLEAIPYEAMTRGIEWKWESFPQYIAAGEQRAFGINIAFVAALTPFRFYVMGEEACERAATVEQTAQIKALLKEAVAAGAFGWTTTTMRQHVGHEGRPLACRLAGEPELAAYCNALRELGKGSIEVALTKSPGILGDGEARLLDVMLTESRRPITWLMLLDRDDDPEACQRSLARAEALTRRGAIAQTNALPVYNKFNLRNPFIFGGFDCCKAVVARPLDQQMRVYADAGFRRAFREESRKVKAFSFNWDLITVQEVVNPGLTRYAGMTIPELAAATRKDAADAFFDLALEDGLETSFEIALFNNDPKRVAKLVADQRTLIGLSDGGAHVDMHDNAGYCTYVLGTWARNRGALSLEEAVRRITSQPADFWGIRDRGRLASGMAADLCIFDYNEIGLDSAAPVKRQQWRTDLPGGGRRLVWPADPGIKYVAVNGQILYDNHHHTGALPGRVLHS